MNGYKNGQNILIRHIRGFITNIHKENSFETTHLLLYLYRCLLRDKSLYQILI